MKKKTLAVLIFALVTITIKAQSNDLIIGNWIFKDAYNKEKIDQAGLEILKTEVINKMTFNFNENGEFESYMMGEIQRGNWELTKGSKKIILHTPENPKTEFNILKLTKNELALKLGLGEFLMVKKNNK